MSAIARLALCAAITITVAAGCSHPSAEVPYVQTPTDVVTEMLRLAKVNAGDVVYDLGSGDGRIVIAAARDFGARGVGIEIDPGLVELSRERAQRAGVADRVTFRSDDLFEADLSDATVVTLYLSYRMNQQLRPKLMRELRPGSRIVSHDYDMGDWLPAQTVRIAWRDRWSDI
ncbi:MAG: SAM-dependent methyltransferase, partial [Candidatus Rokuibacteriota bacterium]